MTTAVRTWTQRPLDIGVAGPTPWDMARAFRSIRADPLSFLVDVQGEYGDLVAFPVPGPPALLVNEPAAVRQVLQTGARHWSKRTAQYTALARVTGPGLLASSEDSWIGHRRLAAPAFHHHRLESVGGQVRAAADEAIGSWDDTVLGRDGAVVDVEALALRIALDAVGRALFSTDLSEAHHLLNASSDAAQLVVRLGRAVLPSPAWVPTSTNLRVRSARRRLDRASAHLVAQRRAHDDGVDGTHGDDLLGLLVDSGLSDDEIRDELVTMVIAGHETVGTALAWTLMLLAEDQPVQDRLRTEVQACTDPVSLVRHRAQLPWTRAVVDEALRLFPPAWALSRRSQQSDVVGGVAVPAGTTVIVSPWLVHRRADLWPDPLAFRPQRFLGDGSARDGYLPFGQGPRLCIGREFALGEMAIVLSRLLSGHRIDLPPAWSRPVPEAQVAVHPRDGMWLRVTRLADRRIGQA